MKILFLLTIVLYSGQLFAQLNLSDKPWESAYINCADSIKKAENHTPLSNAEEGVCLFASFRAADNFLNEVFIYQKNRLSSSLKDDQNGLFNDILIQYESLIIMKESFYTYRGVCANLESASYTNSSGRGNHKVSVLLELTKIEINRLINLPLLAE